ncbi:MAG: creatininase family protein [Deferrisomatales bacterium]
MILTDLTMDAFEAGLRRTRVAVLPVGSVEEHGTHLPLGTDTLQVWEVAVRAVALAPAFLCPPLHYGYCRSTRDHPGTVSISPETVRRTVYDIGSSLTRQGIRGLVIASGHAGGLHMAALEEAGERLVEDHPNLEVAVVCEYRWAQEAGRDGLVETKDDGHAGEIETSRILALAPALVRGTSPEEYPSFATPFIPRQKRPHWPGGVWGDPSRATAEKGEVLLARCAERLAALVRQMAQRVAP